MDEKFLKVLHMHTAGAGDPMDEKRRWTNLTPAKNVKALRKEHHLFVSQSVVRKQLKKHSYRCRKAQKK